MHGWACPRLSDGWGAEHDDSPCATFCVQLCSNRPYAEAAPREIVLVDSALTVADIT